jgi:hypothetical protein
MTTLTTPLPDDLDLSTMLPLVQQRDEQYGKFTSLADVLNFHSRWFDKNDGKRPPLLYCFTDGKLPSLWFSAQDQLQKLHGHGFLPLDIQPGVETTNKQTGSKIHRRAYVSGLLKKDKAELLKYELDSPTSEFIMFLNDSSEDGLDNGTTFAVKFMGNRRKYKKFPNWEAYDKFTEYMQHHNPSILEMANTQMVFVHVVDPKWNRKTALFEGLNQTLSQLISAQKSKAVEKGLSDE